LYAGVVLSKTRNLTVRVDEELYNEIEETADRENVDKSTVARGWLETGLREARQRRGVELYRLGECSLWKAAGVAGVSLREMMDLLVESRVPLHISSDDVEKAWREAFEG
jgi:predicted HTH domain antitoxin